MYSALVMLSIKQCKKINNKIKEYFESNLFDIDTVDLKNKKLFIVKHKDEIIGSFFINTKYDVLDTLFIVKDHRGKGYCAKILKYIKNYIKTNTFLYVDVASDNENAMKCYSKELKYVGIIQNELVNEIYGYVPKTQFVRYELKK